MNTLPGTFPSLPLPSYGKIILYGACDAAGQSSVPTLLSMSSCWDLCALFCTRLWVRSTVYLALYAYE